MATRWNCPYCGHSQIVTNANSHEFREPIRVSENRRGGTVVEISAISCLNEECKELSLVAVLYSADLFSGGGHRLKNVQETWRLLPESNAKPQPDFIPAPLRQDYKESCRIMELSPKASATLARRCLQGMIRDFCGISKGTLNEEIKELRKQVDAGTAPRSVTPESVEAIDQVRSVGNIGAHMEKDINLIIDVEPGEADALIKLIELLFDEWYVAQHTRQRKLAAVAEIATKKKVALKGAKEAGSMPQALTKAAEPGDQGE